MTADSHLESVVIYPTGNWRYSSHIKTSTWTIGHVTVTSSTQYIPISVSIHRNCLLILTQDFMNFMNYDADWEERYHLHPFNLHQGQLGGVLNTVFYLSSSETSLLVNTVSKCLALARVNWKSNLIYCTVALLQSSTPVASDCGHRVKGTEQWQRKGSGLVVL